MARVLGDSARYVSQQAVKNRWRMTNIGAFVIAVVCGGLGFFAGFQFQNKQLAFPTATLLLAGVVAVAWSLLKLGEWKLNQIEKERVAMRKGAVGEAAVAANLA